MIASVLFVCAGNICRSPIAEALFRQIAASRPALASIDIGSAGTYALEGNRATRQAVQIAREELGLDITGHRARSVFGLDADLILTLDGIVTREVERLQPGGRVVLLGEFAGGGEIVEDPYGCTLEVYRTCAQHIKRLVEATADRLAL